LREHLNEGLGIVSRAVASRSTLPVLDNVLVKANGDGQLRLSATDLEIGINCWIGARVEESGAITVPAGTFADLIKMLPPGQVELTLNGETKTLEVDAVRSQSNVKGIDAEEFPVVPAPEAEDGVAIESDVLRLALDQVAFAAATDSSRPILTGVLAEFEDKKLTLAATDGYRLSERVVTLPEPIGEPFRVIIPAVALQELNRIIGEEDDDITISVLDKRQAIFHLSDIVLVAQLLEGNFPDYKGIIPGERATHTVLDTSSFLDACKVARVFARDASNIVRLHVEPGESDLEPGSVEVRAVSAETGDDTTTVDASIEGEDIEVVFNVKYLMEAIKAIHTPQVALDTIGPNVAGVIRPVGENATEFTHVLMPMDLEKRGRGEG
jgi:DNA polymerase-3 subunit beta